MKDEMMTRMAFGAGRAGLAGCRPITLIVFFFMKLCNRQRDSIHMSHKGDWQCETWKNGAVENAVHDNARHENVVPDSRGGKRETWKYGKEKANNMCSFVENTKRYIDPTTVDTSSIL